MPTVHDVDPPGEPPFGRNLGATRVVRAAMRAAGLHTPLAVAGGLNSFELCERVLRDGDADLVASARQSLADPDWWLKMRSGRGAEVRRCMYTNYCEGLDQEHKTVTCQLWDREPEAPGEAPVSRTPDGRRRLTAPRWR
jgi:2,4-dienoyl-CoA reductase-like NADH-dependent reductase (Old Yellow Enzyme family)